MTLDSTTPGTEVPEVPYSKLGNTQPRGHRYDLRQLSVCRVHGARARSSCDQGRRKVQRGLRTWCCRHLWFNEYPCRTADQRSLLYAGQRLDDNATYLSRTPKI